MRLIYYNADVVMTALTGHGAAGSRHELVLHAASTQQ